MTLFITLKTYFHSNPSTKGSSLQVENLSVRPFVILSGWTMDMDIVAMDMMDIDIVDLDMVDIDMVDMGLLDMDMVDVFFQIYISTLILDWAMSNEH